VRLTRFTDYALRVLILLAITEEQVVTIDEIAERYGISRNHLMKIVHRLGTLGYIETMRGQHGGMRLAREPGDIKVGDVVRDFEEDMTIVECFDARSNTCPIDTTCALKGILHQATAEFLATLDRHTLADLIRPQTRLRSLLDMPRKRTG
jgi:Rrf2 family nitric oxide-sensitive transcriptional repressor